jgi:hypothetical protein
VYHPCLIQLKTLKKCGPHAAGARKLQVDVPPLALGSSAAYSPTNTWVIKASRAEAAAAQLGEVRIAYMSSDYVSHLQTNTAAESIAAAKRELASYKAASHATALRAVTAARNALETVDAAAAATTDDEAMMSSMRSFCLLHAL